MHREGRMDTEVSVVIPTFEAEGLIERCLESVMTQIADAEVIVVDNASTDGTVARCKNYPVRVIQNGRNVGFGAACNIGVNAANAKYVLLLNQDAVLLTGVKDAISVLDTTTWAGALGAVMVDGAGRPRPNALRYPRLDNIILKRRSYDRRASSRLEGSESLVTVEYFEFSFAMMRRQDYVEVGGFDEQYFLYGEERDLTYRLGARGLRSVLCPTLRYIHDGGYTDARRKLVVDGQVRFIREHGNFFQRLFYPTLLGVKSRLARDGARKMQKSAAQGGEA